jgi:CRISPR-associated protein Cmr4
MYEYKLLKIKTITNLHVGSGDNNFGVVDNLVQRDVITNIPIINSSSLKGAIRDYFERKGRIKKEKKDCAFEAIFGFEKKDDICQKFPDFGLVKFFEARLLFLPLRSNVLPFFHVTSIKNIKMFDEFVKSFGIDFGLNLDELNPYENENVNFFKNAYIEDVKSHKVNEPNIIKKLKEIFEIENIAILKNEEFNYYVKNLPVIARNKLNNGKSENLWYEEVVPRESIFYTIIGKYINLDESDKNAFKNAYEEFEKDIFNNLIQIGANESIGHGVCEIKDLKEKK